MEEKGIPNTCKAAVFEEVGKKIEIREFKIPQNLEPGSALCRVMLSTICGSDLHTIYGKRKEPTPLILGHEIVGKLVALGEDVGSDGFGNQLQVGDRVSWTIMASCGKCFYCRKGFPQKCELLKKYGHTSCEDTAIHSGLVGGYSEYVYILPGTTMFKIPEGLSDEVAAPANCALSTVVNAVDTIGIERDDLVMVQGAGLLGLNAVALASEAGAKEILSTDVMQSRLQMAKRFGAARTININEHTSEELKEFAMEASEGRGFDVVIEVCGVKEAAIQGIEVLRIGGRYLIAGLVTPGSYINIDGNKVTRNYITIKGIHNYRPEHLGKAIKFLEKNHNNYNFKSLVGEIYPLEKINEAVLAASNGDYIRVGVKPS